MLDRSKLSEAQQLSVHLDEAVAAWEATQSGNVMMQATHAGTSHQFGNIISRDVMRSTMLTLMSNRIGDLKGRLLNMGVNPDV